MRSFLLLVLSLRALPALAQQCGTVGTCQIASTPLSGAELVYLVQNGISVRTTVQQILNQAAAPALVVGATPIQSGTNTYVLYDNAGVLGAEPATTTINGVGCAINSSCVITATAASVTVGTTGVNSGTQNALLYGDGTKLQNASLNGLILGNSTVAPPSAYAGTTCTNQLVVSLSSVGAATCANITNAYLSTGVFSAITGVGVQTQTLNMNSNQIQNALVTSSTNTLGGVAMGLGFDATGDIYYRNSSGLLTRLGIGSTGNVLTVSGGLPSWASGSSAASITVGTTAVNSGSNGNLLYDNSGTLGNETIAALLTAGGNITITGTTNATIAQTVQTPGGRLTLTAGTPVLLSSVTAATSVSYSPYVNMFVPIYNGTNMQMYQFTSSATDQNGLTLTLGSNWTINTVYDVYIALSSVTSGSPVMCTVAWSSGTARATSLSKYNGILTNSASATCRTTNSATISLAANEGTYIGSFSTIGTAGEVSYTFGGSASGGAAALFGVWNYYNRVAVATSVIDTGASYTYTSATIRQARASAGNQIQFLCGVVEDSFTASYTAKFQTANATTSNVQWGLGLNSTSTFAQLPNEYVDAVSTGVGGAGPNAGAFTPALGLNILSANEQSDGNNANTFNISSLNNLSAQLRM